MLINIIENRTLSELVSDLELYSEETLYVNTKMFRVGYAVYAETSDNIRVLFQVTFDSFLHYNKLVPDLEDIIEYDTIVSMYKNTIFISDSHKNNVKTNMLNILEKYENYELCQLIIDLFNES